MLVGEKIRLFPTLEQEQIFKQFCGASRFVYNTCLAEKIRAYNEDGASLSKFDLIKFADSLKYFSDTEWLKDISSGVIRVASQDVINAYNMFYKRGNKGFPKFKKKGKCKDSFGLRSDSSHCRFIDDTHLKFSKIDKPVRIRSHWIPEKIYNPRVSFDGKYWYFSFSYNIEEQEVELTDNIIGVDLGIKSLAVTSDGVVYPNINKTKRVMKLEKRKRYLQRKLSNKYEMNKDGNTYIKTNNIKKLERQIRLIDRRLSNIRKTYIHTVTMSIVKTKPCKIVIEDLNVSGMLKNKHLSRSIQNQLLYFFRYCLDYKCKFYGNINLVVADRYYPSSKKCNNCGVVKKFLALSERLYHCNCCDFTIDRDLNASLNLKDYGFLY